MLLRLVLQIALNPLLSPKQLVPQETTNANVTRQMSSRMQQSIAFLVPVVAEHWLFWVKSLHCVLAFLPIQRRLALQAQRSSQQLSHHLLLLPAQQTCRPPLLPPLLHHQLRHQLQRLQLQHHHRPQLLAVMRLRPVKLVPMLYLTVQSHALSLPP